MHSNRQRGKPMPTKRLEKEEQEQAEAATSEKGFDTRKGNTPKEGADGKIRIEDPTEEKEKIEDPVDEDEEDLEDEEEEQAEDAETSGA
jgi:hypothetical protein